MSGEGNENHVLKTQGEMNVLSTNKRVQTHCVVYMFEVFSLFIFSCSRPALGMGRKLYRLCSYMAGLGGSTQGSVSCLADTSENTSPVFLLSSHVFITQGVLHSNLSLTREGLYTIKGNKGSQISHFNSVYGSHAKKATIKATSSINSITSF